MITLELLLAINFIINIYLILKPRILRYSHTLPLLKEQNLLTKQVKQSNLSTEKGHSNRVNLLKLKDLHYKVINPGSLRQRQEDYQQGTSKRNYISKANLNCKPFNYPKKRRYVNTSRRNSTSSSWRRPSSPSRWRSSSSSSPSSGICKNTRRNKSRCTYWFF